MTAGLFHSHGIWVGTSRGGNENNPKGFFENTKLKQLQKKIWGWDLQALAETPPEPDPDFKWKALQLIREQGWSGEPWLYKQSALYWRAWDDFNPKFICVRRDIEQTVQSNIDCGLHRGKWSREQLTDIIESHHREMDIVREVYDGIDVFTDQLIERDYSSLKQAFDYCGIEMKKEVVDEFITPGYWKHPKRTTQGL